MATDPNIVTESLIKDITVNNTEELDGTLLPENPIEQNSIEEPIEVAGRFTPNIKPKEIIDKLKAETQKAEERTLPKVPDDPVIIQNDTIVVRQAEPDELNQLETLINETDASGSGINFIRLVDEANIPEIDGENIGKFLEAIKIKNKKLFDRAKRGQLNMQSILDLAEKAGMGNVIKKFLKKKPGEILPAEDLLQGILAVVNMRTEISKAINIAKGIDDNVLREQEMGKVLRMIAMQTELVSQVSANASEMARGMSVLRNISSINVNLKNYSESLQGLVESFDDAKTVEYLLDRYSVLEPSGQQIFMKQSLAGRTMDAVIEAFINGILSSWSTHIVNLSSTALNISLQVPLDVVAGGIGYARTSLFGGTKRAYALEGLSRLHGMRMAMMDALLISGKSFIKEEPIDFSSKIDVRNRKAITAQNFGIDPQSGVGGLVNAYGIYTRLSGRFLVAEDEFMKVIAARGALYAEAHKRSTELYHQLLSTADRPGGNANMSKAEARALADQEYLDLITNPPEDMMKNAREEAKNLAFQGDLDGLLASLIPTMSHPMAKLFIPFYKTPTNVISETYKYSPLGMIKVVKELRSGNPEIADKAMSKVVVGSGIMATLAYLTWDGGYGKDYFITGAGPTDYTVRQAWRRKGIQPYSLCVKGENPDAIKQAYTCKSYSRFEPIGGVLAMAADFSYYAQHENDPDVLSALATAAVVSMAEYAGQMPFLDGVSDIAEIAGHAYPTTQDKITRIAEMLTEKAVTAVASGIPTMGAFTASIERIQRPGSSLYQKPPEGRFLGNELMPVISELPAPMRGFYRALYKAQSRNPFFSDNVPPALDRWGVQMQQSNGIVWETFSPVRVTNEKFNMVDEEIMALGMGIRMPNKKIDGVLLNGVQYNTLLTYAADLDANERLPDDPGYDYNTSLLPSLETLIMSDSYQNMPSKTDKLTAINNIVNARDAAARRRLIGSGSVPPEDFNLRSLIERSK